jgi:hypothetical protein
VLRTESGEFEGNLAALCRELLAPRPAVAETRGDSGVDLYLSRHGEPPGSYRIELATGSGKTVTATYLLAQAKRWSGGFTASTRTLARAGMNTEMLRYFTAAHELAHRSWGTDAGALARSTDSAPLAEYMRLDGRTVAEKAFGCALPFPAAIGLDAANTGVDEQAVASIARLRSVYETALRHAAEAMVELARMLSELAMAARSHRGLPAAPVPTEPPGEIVRSHPRVPRGPGFVLCTWRFWPTGGVLSMA